LVTRFIRIESGFEKVRGRSQLAHLLAVQFADRELQSEQLGLGELPGGEGAGDAIEEPGKAGAAGARERENMLDHRNGFRRRNAVAGAAAPDQLAIGSECEAIFVDGKSAIVEPARIKPTHRCDDAGHAKSPPGAGIE
jgi:hypothetical protein